MNKEKHLGFEVIATNTSGQQTVKDLHDFVMQFLKEFNGVSIIKKDKGVSLFITVDFCVEYYCNIAPCYPTEEKIKKLQDFFSK